MFQCDVCFRSFPTSKGLQIHIGRTHRDVPNHQIQQVQVQIEEEQVPQHGQDTQEVQQVANAIPLNLPNHPTVNLAPSTDYHNRTGAGFFRTVSNTYEAIVKWRKNLFKLPSGRAAKDFINELTLWLKHYNNNTDFHGIALKVFMILPCLLLQKPSRTSKAKEHLKKLEERLTLWKDGHIEVLLNEGLKIQQRLTTSKRRTSDDVSRAFAKLILEGKINAALKMISEEASNGVLDLDDKTMADLRKKHPAPSPVSEGSLIQEDLPAETAASYFDCIDEQQILKAAQLTKGAGGPSNLDAEQYRRILISAKYKNEGKNLREQIAILARKLATELVDPKTLEAFVAYRLIPLDKCPGVRPIGIGEILRRIIGKVIGWALKEDIQIAAGPLQAATGLQGGAEAAIHAMKQVFEDENTEAVILVDASNAFNSLNRQVALHNIQHTCPPFAKVLINTYRQPSRLFVAGGKEISSREGTTQGDNLAGPFCPLNTTPLQNKLRETSPEIKQVWLADDATGGGSITNLKSWWDTIINEGAKFG